MRVVLTDEALTDLASIRLFIAEHSPIAADRIGRRLVEACDSLSRLPDRGRPGLVTGTRELTVVPPYVIVYRAMAETIEVLRIWHGAQDR
jgi:plasmid stabilization system protein ParE